MALSTCQIVTVSKFKVPEGILDTVAFGIASTQTQTRSNRSNHLLTPFRLLLLGQCHVQIMEVALKLTENASLSEVVTNCYNLKFHGSGEKETPCMTVRGLQRLLMLLGGKVAAQYREIREIVESVFTRYTAGDTSLRHGSEHEKETRELALRV